MLAMDQAGSSQRTIVFSLLRSDDPRPSFSADKKLLAFIRDLSTDQKLLALNFDLSTGQMAVNFELRGVREEEMNPSQESSSSSPDSDDDIPASPACSNTDIHELLGSLSITPENEEPARPRVRERSPSLDRNRSCLPESLGNRMQSEELISVRESSQEELRRDQRELNELQDMLRDLRGVHITHETERDALTDIRAKAKRCADSAQDFPGFYRRFTCIMRDADRQLNSLNER